MTDDQGPTNPVPTAPEPTPVKPGYRTTEFYLSSLAKLLGILFASGVLGDGSLPMRIAGLAATLLAALGYTVSRGLVKAAGALLLVFAIGATQPACAGRSAGDTLKAIPGEAKSAVIDCGKQNAAPILALAFALGAQALLAEIDQGSIDWPALEASAATEGKVVGGCALTHFVTGLARAPRSDTAVRALVAGPDLAGDGRAAIARLSKRFDRATWR